MALSLSGLYNTLKTNAQKAVGLNTATSQANAQRVQGNIATTQKALSPVKPPSNVASQLTIGGGSGLTLGGQAPTTSPASANTLSISNPSTPPKQVQSQLAASMSSSSPLPSIKQIQTQDYSSQPMDYSQLSTPASTYAGPDRTQLDALGKSYADSFNLSPEQIAAQNDLTNLNESFKLGQQEISDKAIPMRFITGQQASNAQLAGIKEQTLNERLANVQAQQTAKQQGAKTAYELEKDRYDASQPVEVGGNLINPLTGEVVYQSPISPNSTSNQKDYEYAKSQGYSGSFLDFQRQLAMLDPSAYKSTTDAFGNTSVVNLLDPSSGMRTDRHNNPTAFTTDIAKQAGLVEGVDYTRGDAFPNNPNLFTATLLGDPIATTIKVIDKIGAYKADGTPRWTYANQIPELRNWSNLSQGQKSAAIQKMYQFEGGSGNLGGGSTGLASQYQAYQSNPSAFEKLSQEARNAINNYAVSQGKAPLSGSPTDAQAKAGSFASRLASANQTFDALESTVKRYTPTQLYQYQLVGNQGGLVGAIGNQFVPAQAQQQLQAQREFINALLRRESGATILPSEFMNYGLQYFPQPGDKPEVLAQKKQARTRALQGLISESGNSYSPTSGGSAQFNFGGIKF